MKNILLNVLAVILFIIICIAQYNLWIGEYSISDVLRIRNSYNDVHNDIENISRINDDLYEELKVDPNDKELLKHYARLNFGLVGENEKYYEIKGWQK